jgi:hypothetical protein
MGTTATDMCTTTAAAVPATSASARRSIRRA